MKILDPTDADPSGPLAQWFQRRLRIPLGESENILRAIQNQVIHLGNIQW
jgi:hypothetical protein